MTTTRGFITYQQDNGTNCSIRANSATATYNGQSVSKYPPVGVPFPFGYRDLRHVYGEAPSGVVYRMTVCDPTTYSGITIGTSTFQNSNGQTCTVTCKIGEKSKFKDAR